MTSPSPLLYDTYYHIYNRGTNGENIFVQESKNVKKRERMGWFAVVGVVVVLLLGIMLAQIGYFNRLIYRPVDMEDYWVTIPAGKFQMGSENGEDNEKPIHTVIVDEFQIGKYEVTNRQYSQCVKAGICVENAFGESKDLYPVVNVTWYDARAYCDWVDGRLPIEAEWEKAARGGLDGKDYPGGDDLPTCAIGALNGVNFGGNGCPGDTMPVGIFGPNKYGLYDMAGNVWEWTSSLYQPYPYDAADGREDLSLLDDRALRGGSWLNLDYNVRSAIRSRYGPTSSLNSVGFRCARSLP